MTNPSQGPSDGLTKLENRVKNLIAKANATDFEEEAETYRLKAAKLIAQYSIDEARLFDQSEGQRAIVSAYFPMTMTYAREFQRLLGVIARAMSCSGLDYSDGSGSFIYGSKTQLDQVEMYYDLIWPQMAAEVEAAEPPVDISELHGMFQKYTAEPVQPTDHRKRAAATTRHRRAFAAGYAVRVGQRLDQAVKEAVHEEEVDAVPTNNFGSGALVLQTEQQRAEAMIRQDFSASISDKPSKPTRYDNSGLNSGYAAGDRANIGQTAVSNNPRSLT